MSECAITLAGEDNKMQEMVKVCAVSFLVLGGGALSAEPLRILEATQDTKVCTMVSFMENVSLRGKGEEKCSMVKQGSTASLAGVLNATPPLYMVLDGDLVWYVVDANHWRVRRQGEGL